MAKDKKLRANINGVKVKDGDLVTLVVQARVSVVKRARYNGGEVEDVELVIGDGDSYIDAYDNKENGKHKIAGAAILRTKP